MLNRVGAGGFGTVLRARDPELDRVVALKIPHLGRLADAEHRRRFLEEARHLAHLRHPAVVPVYEVGEASGVPFLVTEFVQGTTLAGSLKQRRPTPHEAAALCARIAEALHHAHEAGIVHRDVKPGNLMLDEQGEPFLMDFGLAKDITGEITISTSGEVLGTPAYMSPEQAAGESQAVDRRTDVYSLGVVLYELLTGELPFRGNNQMVLYQLLHEEPRPPRALNHRVPQDLERVCLKAMSKEPAHRYATARQMQEDLGRYLRSEPVHARPVGLWSRLWLWCRRPDRIREASTITVAMALMLAFWELQGLFFLGFGLYDVGSFWKSAMIISGGMLGFSALAGIGWVARSRPLAALWTGAVVSVGLMFFAIGCLWGFIQIEGLAAKAVRIPVFGFFSVAAAFMICAHLVSLIAYYSNPSAMRWARKSRPAGDLGD